jgi:hypothetical protein
VGRGSTVRTLDGCRGAVSSVRGAGWAWARAMVLDVDTGWERDGACGMRCVTEAREVRPDAGLGLDVRIASYSVCSY